MKTAVREFVQACVTCQQSKYDRAKLPGLLQPLPVPDSAWQVLSLDFIEGLPTSQSYNCILVVVDLLTKYGHFIPLRHPFTAAGVAKAFFANVYRHHGLPHSIISDRDRIFTSHFWSELFQLANVKLCRSTAYHPQSDGQTERLNQCLETYLRCFVHATPTKWSKWLTSAEFWYNTSSHSAIGRSPSRHCMATHLVCLLLTPIRQPIKKCSTGLLSVSSWMSYYSSTSIGLRVA